MGVAIAGLRIRLWLGTPILGLPQIVPIVIGVVGAVGLLLAALHGIEATILAAAYLWLGLLDSPRDAMLYSVDSMTTRGASGLMLQRHWQMMGALEAADGMLLFGNQYGIHVRGDAGVLADAHDPPSQNPRA